MKELIKRSSTVALGIFSLVTTIVTDDFFLLITLFHSFTDEWNCIINKALFLALLFIISCGAIAFAWSILWYKKISGKNYTVIIKRKDIFKVKNGVKVIPFDECFSCDVGSIPGEVYEKSICANFLKNNRDIPINDLIKSAKLESAGYSKFRRDGNATTCYESGRLVPYDTKNDHYFLLAFAKLNADGKCCLSRDELLESLAVMWKELETRYAQRDVYIPILASGQTLMGESLTHQELLDIIIESYLISPHKLKNPAKLYIVYKRRNFSFSKIRSAL